MFAQLRLYHIIEIRQLKNRLFTIIYANNYNIDASVSLAVSKAFSIPAGFFPPA